MKTKDIVNISLFATLLAVCAWISIPTVVPFTMQTFAVFLAMLVLGGKKGTIVIFIYLFLGIIGVPVFSRGTAGAGILFGSTGGYLIGWIFLGLIMYMVEYLLNHVVLNVPVQKYFQLAGLIIGLLISYLFGTLWFMRVYALNNEAITFASAFGICVAPFIIPDLIKMLLAVVVSKRIRKIVENV